MSDPTQFIVNLSTIHRLLQHQGLIATGRDLMTSHPCSLHSYSDKFKRTYIMQLFDSVDSDFVSSKLNSIVKATHSTFLPNVIRPSILATRKTNKSFYELAVIYDNQGIGELTLAQLIKAKRGQNEKFEPDQLSAFFWQIVDFFMLSAKNNSEYLDINPLNIYCKIDGFYGYNFFLANYGKQSKKQQYHNPLDKFYKGEKNHENALSSSLFMLGMIILELATMLPSQQIYQNGTINEKALQKRIEGAKLTSDRMISSALPQLLELNEVKRLKVTEVYKNDEWLKLRKVIYYQSKIDFFEFRNFQGIVDYDKKTSIGQALDKDLSLLRGTFNSGVFQGRGVREKGNNLEAGVFVEGSLTEGQSVQKNNHFEIGKFKNGHLLQGIRLILNISNLSKEGRNLTGFIGECQSGQPGTGNISIAMEVSKRNDSLFLILNIFISGQKHEIIQKEIQQESQPLKIKLISIIIFI